MMEYKTVSQRDERNGGSDEKRRYGLPAGWPRLSSVAPSRTQSNQSKVSSRFNPPSLKLRRTRVQSSKSRKPVALGRTQSNHPQISRTMQQKLTKQTKLICHARNRHQGESPSLPSVQIPSGPPGYARFSRISAPTSLGSVKPVQPCRTQSKLSSRFNPPSLKLRRTRVQSSKSRKTVALSRTQSNRSHPIKPCNIFHRKLFIINSLEDS
jgi:hypothetical protein